MKKKYVNNLPNGKEVIGTEVSVEDGKLVVEVEFEDEFYPNDGDFLVSKSGKVFIYSKKTPDNSFVYSAYCGVRKDDVIRIDFSNRWTPTAGCRFATPEEKSAFLDRLEKECHKTWNADKKCLEDVYVPKFGDVVKVINGSFAFERDYTICIYPNRNEQYNKCYVEDFFDIANINMNGILCFGCGNAPVGRLRIMLASESEKKELFDKLAEVGKRWNPETKQLEDIRWRADKDCTYYYVDDRGNVLGCNDTRGCASDSRYSCGNYFKTREAARPYADQIKEIFKKSKAE